MSQTWREDGYGPPSERREPRTRARGDSRDRRVGWEGAADLRPRRDWQESDATARYDGRSGRGWPDQDSRVGFDPDAWSRDGARTTTRVGGHGRVGPPQSARRRQPQRRPSAWGSLTGRGGVVIVAGSAAFGTLVTVIIGAQPGALISILLVAGTLIASFAVRQRASYVIIPVPALAYFIAAMTAGIADDPAARASRTTLMVAALQWMASGFFAMAVATVLAVVIVTARWATARRRAIRSGAAA